MSYLAYHFQVTPPQPGSEILMAMIADWPFDSFDTTESGFTAYIKREDAADVNLSMLVFDDFTYTVKIEEIANTNWNAEWEKNFEPVLVDDLLCIRAPFHSPNKSVKHEIVIMPKMSFGTGHHQTTRQMCKEMFANTFNNIRVLDMGCGTGILAILAKMLGAAQVTGIDIDEWSVENARENCAANNYPDIDIKKGDADLLPGLGRFDVVLANINKNILKRQLPYYKAITSAGAQLYLSGFFTTDVPELSEVAAANGFKFIRSNSENEWAMIRFERV